MRVEVTIQDQSRAVATAHRQIIPSIGTGIPRFIEVVVAVAGLIIFAPFLVLATAVVYLTSPGPVMFRQQRMGRGGRTFTLYKLRTMQFRNEGPQLTGCDDTRVTAVGRFLRQAKLDELPQLWNVLEGSMSLVGPRPEVPLYVDLENPMWKLVLEVKPGITDPMTLRLRSEEMLLAEVVGDHEDFYLRALQPFKLKEYLTYLQARNWWSDLKVLWKSSVVVVFPSRVPPLTLKEISLSDY